MAVKVAETVAEPEETVAEPEAELEASTEEPEAEEAKAEVKEPEPITFKTQADLDKHISQKAQTLADSIANKGMATYQQQVSDLKKQLRAKEDVKEDAAIARLTKSFKDGGEEAAQIADFETAVTDLVKRERTFRDVKAEWDEKHEKATQSVKEVNAFTEALSLLLPEDEAGFVSSLTALAKKIAGAETDKEKALIIELEKANLIAQAQGKPKRVQTKPDTGLPTASGGAGEPKTLEDKLAKALAEERKKLKLT